MINNTNDVYKLISSPDFVAKWEPVTPIKLNMVWSYTLFNRHNPHHRVSIAKNGTDVKIIVTNHMNYEYYENLRTTNKRHNARIMRLHDVAFAKYLATMMNDVAENYR